MGQNEDHIGQENEDPSRTLDDGKPLYELGSRIGSYKLLRILGEGGFGIVYLAEQQRPIKRQVALKIIKPGMDSAQVIRRFEAERQALALLDHPNVAHVYDAGTTEAGRPYFAMEYVKGVPITEHCDRQKLTIEERLKLFVQVCEAIQHAHQKGIIHRDIKPSNIQVCIQGEQVVPKVIDFGVAKALSQPLTERTLVTEQGQLIGTPEYISPEQAEMTNQDIDTRSDIYSLGVLLYELLTGTLPFESQTLRRGSLEQMRAVLREEEPKTPSTRVSSLEVEASTRLAKRCQSDAATLRRRLRGDLDWITLKAMEKDRMRRYQTAHALAEDIERHLNNEPVLAGRPGALYRFQKLVRRNKGVFAAVAVVAVVLVLGASVSTWQAALAKRAERREARLRQEAQANELAMRRFAYASDVSLAQQALSQNNLGRAQALLDRHRPKTGERDLRGWEWRYLRNQCRSDELMTLTQQSLPPASLTASPDGKWLAIGEDEKGGLAIWDLATRQEIPRLPAGESLVRATFSPREPLLAFGATINYGSPNQQSSVKLWNGNTREIVGEFPLSGECAALAFSEDGRTLVTATTDDPGQLTLWSVADRKVLHTHPIPQLSNMISWRRLAVTGDLSVAACLSGRMLHILDLATGKPRWAQETPGFFATCAFSPDGKILATSCGYAETVIRLWDVESGRELRPLAGHSSCVYDLLFWPDGQKLASAGSDQTIRVWDLASGQSMATFRGHQHEIWQLALLPDNRTLVSGSKDGSVRFWDTGRIGRDRSYTRLPTRLRTWCFDTDSRSVLTVDWQGRVARGHGVDFQEIEPLFEVSVNSVVSAFCPDQFSPDRRLLATAAPNGVVQVWDLQRRESIKEIPAHTGTVFPIAFLAQATRLVLLHPDDGSLHEWDLARGQETQWWAGIARPSAVSFSPDERWCLMFGYQGARRVRDMTNGQATDPELRIATALHVGTTESVAFSPDGRLFAAATWGSFAWVYEMATLREVATLGRFVLGAHSAAFSPDGTRLVASGTGRETIKLWDMESRQEVLTLESQESRFVHSAFSPDGNILGALSMEGFLHLWRAPSWAEIEAAEKKQSGQSP